MNSVPSFNDLVSESWSSAVAKCSFDFSTWEPQVLEALNSESPELRSAAVATIYEADSVSHREALLGLTRDPDEHVRNEVLEYLGEYALPEDAPRILESLYLGCSLFLATSALARLYPEGPGFFDEDDLSTEGVANLVSAWANYIEGCSRGAT